ncbi:PUA-like domain-containing protein [Lasiosphaeria miniovina]|uniref:PUA-like domain-containing protein n=1 Tax=Lasiosphaeria miniovina TaxID=1954250 RepID=A0AA40DR77_9PEZI|nr:PUA-like domain-containing protein [Lasiosphaeria miniovina]KAK0710287.1 PUA-like domain-containing protein [Lasiosphaeria miniovina]
MSAVDPSRPDIVAFMAKDIFNFSGDNAALADEKLALAIQGKKSATTSWPIPDPMHWGVGDLSIILDGNGAPGAVMRTTSFVRCLFRDVAEDFALAEAEGDYNEYREGHIWFYNAEEQKKPEAQRQLFGDDSMVLCERFEVIYPPKPAEVRKEAA